MNDQKLTKNTCISVEDREVADGALLFLIKGGTTRWPSVMLCKNIPKELIQLTKV